MESAIAEVGFTWDGRPVGPDERARLVIRPGRTLLEVLIEAPYHGDPPPEGPVGSLDGLWEHEVVELFIAGLGPAGQPTPYVELEFSPHGYYLLIDLFGIRRPIRSGMEIEYSAEICGDSWRGRALIPTRWLPSRPARFNAFAIHGVGEERRYLAMSPPGGPKPDFHQLDAFSRWPF